MEFSLAGALKILGFLSSVFLKSPFSPPDAGVPRNEVLKRDADVPRNMVFIPLLNGGIRILPLIIFVLVVAGLALSVALVLGLLSTSVNVGNSLASKVCNGSKGLLVFIGFSQRFLGVVRISWQ